MLPPCSSLGWAFRCCGSTRIHPIVSREEPPFFQHFKLMIVQELAREEASRMLEELYRRSEYSIDKKLIDRMVEVVGGHPFYLQVLGEETCRRAPARIIDDSSFKEAFQETVLTDGGRLDSYFESLFRPASDSTLLERTAIAIAEGKTQITEIGRAIGLTPGTAYAAIRRLQDLDVVARRNGGYDYVDPLLNSRSKFRERSNDLVV